MQIGSILALGVEGKGHPFARLQRGNIDIRGIKDTRAHIVAGWLRGVRDCN